MLPRRNVLIFHAGALGDLVLTWPLALALSRLYPQSRIYFVTHGSKAALAERVLRVEGADIESGWSALHSVDAPLAPPVEKLLSSAHSVFTFLSSGTDAWSDRVRTIAPEAALIPLALPAQAFSGPVHATEMIAEQLAPWPVVQTSHAQLLRSVADRGTGYRLVPDGAVVIHPGSGSPGKNWPAARYLELARRLVDTGRKVNVVIGEVEAEKWPAVDIAAFEQVAQVLRPASYLDLLDVLAAASQFIGNDSGPGHLAGIIGLSTISLFGATDPVVWKPLGPKVRVIRGSSLEAISVDEVFAAVVTG